MSVILDENNYILLRNNDPSYQAMTRVSDANNTYDIRQEYIKTGETRNDFQSQLDLFNKNKGILNDGLFIDMTNFFTDTERNNDGTGVISTPIPYFKFKTNAVLNFRNSAHIKDTYIDKTNVESIYELKPPVIEGNKEVYSFKEEKSLIENSYNSYPLQRNDKLQIYELDSLFLYINGKKIPDNEIFIYANKSFTDVFIPEKYINGKIREKDSMIDDIINIDYRQAGSELFYDRFTPTENEFTIDLSDPKFQYNKSSRKDITLDKIVMFVNGYIERVPEMTLTEESLTLQLPASCIGADVELYILGDIVHRHKFDISLMNNTGSRVHFYLNDNYFSDIIGGPITKSAVSFFYDGKRIDDTKIVQTSRYSFEYTVDTEKYVKVTRKAGVPPIQSKIYYTKNLNNEYIRLGHLDSFEDNVIYYTKEVAETFDESKIDFFIEDIGFKIDELGFKTYGDDYYLLNMLGVKRCVDKMKGCLSYSVFDNPVYNISFKDVLSKNGDLFDVEKAIKKYTNLAFNTSSPSERAKLLISERPSLLRRLLEQFSNKSKRFIVMGNTQDINVSSIYKIADPEQNIYYKIYLNHEILDSKYVTIVRENDFDYITISKDALLPLVENEEGNGYKSGINIVEMFQFDLSYKEKTIYRENINNGFTQEINRQGEYVYRKTYNVDDLPFEKGLVSDDICAIEKVAKDWYDSRNEEFYYIYPGPEKYGWRMVKHFRVVSKTETELTIEIQLHEYDARRTNGNFYLLAKQYNVSESIRFDNTDGSYMEENDLLIPVYSSYTAYKTNELGEKVVDFVDDYIPYINNSEPIITKNKHELIFGKDYTFMNPEKNPQLSTSYVIFKNQTAHNDEIIVQFNSNKTNILIVGYDDLEIDNRFGLVYLSELPYPVSTDYMNIYVNGLKMSDFDIDILSDKLIRVHNITRPIRSILITTNSIYKDIELKEYIDLYEPSPFEKLLESIFWNCDPSKHIDGNKPNIDYVYKVDPYYSDFVGDLGKDYDNPYYKEYVDYIKEHGYEYDKTSSYELSIPAPDSSLENFELRYEAWEKARNFFNIYRDNHGFIIDVDSVKQAENPLAEDTTNTYLTDTLEIMYLNWLANSGKTRTYGFKGQDIDPQVLNYFSVFENVIIGNRIDIVVDSGRFYDGLKPDVNNPPYEVDWDTEKIKIVYPAMNFGERRRMLFEMLIQTLEKRQSEDDIKQFDETTKLDNIVVEMCNNKLSNILYPEDFPLSPDRNGVMWTGSDVDICNYTTPDSENPKLQAAILAEQELRARNN